MTEPATITVPGRACGACTLCCDLPDIDELDKPANTLCRHCVRDQGCLAYEARPNTCRSFYCSWMTDPLMAAEWEPAHSHMMVYRQGQQLTVLVDPRRPDVWRGERYLATLKRWAGEEEAMGGYVIVFVGDEVMKIAP
jgi:hypothetical protein